MKKGRDIWIVTVDEPLFYGRMYRRIIEAVPEKIAGLVVLPHPTGSGLDRWLKESVYRFRFWGPKAFGVAAIQLFRAKVGNTGNAAQAARAAGSALFWSPTDS